MNNPDFDTLAVETLIDQAELLTPDDVVWYDALKNRIAEQLRQVWNAGFDAGGRHETFVQHLKDENNAAHLALDRLNAPKTKQVPRRDGNGKQDITTGLAERIDAARRQVWNARGAADLAAMETAHTNYDWTELEDALRSLDR